MTKLKFNFFLKILKKKIYLNLTDFFGLTDNLTNHRIYRGECMGQIRSVLIQKSKRKRVID